MPHNTEEIRHVYKSKYNLKHENQVIFLMISDGEKILAVKKFSTMLKQITSKILGRILLLKLSAFIYNM